MSDRHTRLGEAPMRETMMAIRHKRGYCSTSTVMDTGCSHCRTGCHPVPQTETQEAQGRPQWSARPGFYKRLKRQRRQQAVNPHWVATCFPRLVICVLAILVGMTASPALAQRARPAQAEEPEVELELELIGELQRPLTDLVEVAVTVNNPTALALRARADFSVTDRNHAAVANRGFELELAPGETREILAIPLEAVHLYLPPFRLRGDVISADVPGLAATLDATIVMGNARVLFDAGTAVHANWYTAGTDRTMSEWLRWWLHAEAQRASPLPQRSARISRDPVDPHTPEADDPLPWRGPTALRIDFDGHAIVYRGADRHLPGNPYRMGLWVEGDGSGAELRAMFLDYTQFIGYNWNDWRRIMDGERLVCTLDFTGWRFVWIDLPGDGLGENTPRGSTAAVDYPLEWTYLEVVPAEDGAQQGTVRIGAVFVETQQPQPGMLALHVGWDDPDGLWDPSHDAWITVQNAALEGSRDVELNWRLTDRSGQSIVDARLRETLGEGMVLRQRLDLAAHADAVAGHTGPFMLVAEATDRGNPSVRAERTRVLAHPDSEVLLADFEQARGYHSPVHSWDRYECFIRGSQSLADADGWAVSPSAQQAKRGERSLALPWNTETRPATTVSIDPAIPGVPVSIRMWVHGDGSGARLHPIVGDRPGVPHSWRRLQHNIFHLRTADESAAQIVTVDWKGWREVDFRLPPIPPGWNDTHPVQPFVPNYPLGLHMTVYAPDGDEATPREGVLFIDEIRVSTHLAPAQRTHLTLTPELDGNRIDPGTPLALRVRNTDRREARTLRLEASLTDWQGNTVAAADSEITLAPLGEHREPLTPTAPEGVFLLRAVATQEDGGEATLQADLVVAAAATLYGPDAPALPRSIWELRRPIGERYQELEEDWDWIEPFPGNTQFMSLRRGIDTIREQGGDPWMRLGFSAYWAAGIGFESFQSGSFERAPRDAGHAVDVLQPPARVEDWELFVAEVMRETGDQVEGWLLWDGPDAVSGPLALPPDFFARLLEATDRWRRQYAPERPILAGGLNRYQAVDYLAELSELEPGLGPLDGVHVRMDVGRHAPEDAQLTVFVQTLHDLLGPRADGHPKMVLLTELDWAVETDDAPDRIGAFEQAAYLARAELLLLGRRVQNVVDVRNAQASRLGLGLAYRQYLSAPPLHEQVPDYWLKPAWVGLQRLRERLREWGLPREEHPQHRVPDRTRGLIFEDDDRALAVIWRLDGPGQADFAPAGLTVQAATDLFGTPVRAVDGRYPVGIVPVFFVVDGHVATGALRRVQVRGADGLHWAEETLAVFDTAGGETASDDATEGATPEDFTDWRLDGYRSRERGLRFAEGGEETLTLAVPPGAGLALRKRYVLDDETGHVADVHINGVDPLRWDLERQADDVGEGGFREALLPIPAALLGASEEGDAVTITVRYPAGARISRWTALAWRGEPVSLGQVGLFTINQPQLSPRIGRNVTGGPLRVGAAAFDDGIGVYAPSAITVVPDGRFRRLTGAVGIDAITEGRGAVRFEVLGDGRRLWASPVRTGLDEPLPFDIEIEGVKRLRFVVTDATEGAGMGAANWCDTQFHH